MVAFFILLTLKKVVLSQGKTQAELSYIQDSGRLRIDSRKSALYLDRTPYGVVARDEAGNKLYTSTTNEDGSISLYNGENKLVRTVSAKEIESAKNRIVR